MIRDVKATPTPNAHTDSHGRDGLHGFFGETNRRRNINAVELRVAFDIAVALFLGFSV
jgi:hypothetical protein